MSTCFDKENSLSLVTHRNKAIPLHLRYFHNLNTSRFVYTYSVDKISCGMGTIYTPPEMKTCDYIR